MTTCRPRGGGRRGERLRLSWRPPRTPLTKMGGRLQGPHADKLMTSVIKASLKETGIDAADIGDITVAPPRWTSGVAQFEVGMPDIVLIKVTHRACSSRPSWTPAPPATARPTSASSRRGVAVRSARWASKTIWPRASPDLRRSTPPADGHHLRERRRERITRERQDCMGMLSMNNCEIHGTRASLTGKSSPSRLCRWTSRPVRSRTSSSRRTTRTANHHGGPGKAASFKKDGQLPPATPATL